MPFNLSMGEWDGGDNIIPRSSTVTMTTGNTSSDPRTLIALLQQAARFGMMSSDQIETLHSSFPKLDIKIPSIANLPCSWLDKSKCPHPLLHCFEDVYHCHYCSYQLETNPSRRVADIERIQAETEKERGIPLDNVPLGLDRFQLQSYMGKKSQERGVSINFLLAFARHYQCYSWSVREVLNNVIKPATEPLRCRYVELEGMEDNTGPAQTFICYAQEILFGDVLAAIIDGSADRTRRVWLDIFCARQWHCSQPEAETTCTIKHCSSFLCVSPPMGDFHLTEKTANPPVDMSRKIAISDRMQNPFYQAECIAEIVVASQLQIPKILKLGRHRLIGAHCLYFESANGLYSPNRVFDVKLCDAKVPSEKIRIISEIEGGVGLDRANEYLSQFGSSLKGLNHTEFEALIPCAAFGDEIPLSIVCSACNECLLPTACAGFPDLLQRLIDEGANVNHNYGEGWSALARAAQGGNVRCIQLLIDHGADVNHQDDNLWTPLMAAAREGRTDSVNALIKNGADMTLVDILSRTAWEFAAEKGYSHIQSILEHAGYEPSYRERRRAESKLLFHESTTGFGDPFHPPVKGQTTHFKF